MRQTNITQSRFRTSREDSEQRHSKETANQTLGATQQWPAVQLGGEQEHPDHVNLRVNQSQRVAQIPLRGGKTCPVWLLIRGQKGWWGKGVRSSGFHFPSMLPTTHHLPTPQRSVHLYCQHFWHVIQSQVKCALVPVNRKRSKLPIK